MRRAVQRLLEYRTQVIDRLVEQGAEADVRLRKLGEFRTTSDDVVMRVSRVAHSTSITMK